MRQEVARLGILCCGELERHLSLPSDLLFQDLPHFGFFSKERLEKKTPQSKPILLPIHYSYLKDGNGSTAYFPITFWSTLLNRLSDTSRIPLSTFLFLPANDVSGKGDYILDFSPSFGCLSLLSALLQELNQDAPPYVAFATNEVRRGQDNVGLRRDLAHIELRHTTWCKTQLEFLAGIQMSVESLEEVKNDMGEEDLSFDPLTTYRAYCRLPSLYFTAAVDEVEAGSAKKKRKTKSVG